MITNKRNWILILLIPILLMAGCSQNSADIGGSDSTDTAEMFSSRDYEVGYDESESVMITLDGSTAYSDSDAVQISGQTVTVTDEGTYILSGALDDGTIVVNAEKTDKLQLVLDGVSIHSESSAAIYVLQADKVFLTLAAGSNNTLSGGNTFTAVDENNIDAVVFSKEDLTLNGSGSLTIESPAGHGVVSKDDLVLTSGTYNITAASHGLSGKDSVRIASGNYTITSGKDGIHAENTDDTSLGFVYISGGSFDLTAQGDGLSAASYLQIEDGTFHVLAGGGSAAVPAAEKSQTGNFGRTEPNTSSPENTASTKGIKASGDLILNGGTFAIDCADDALHSNSNLTINGGTYQIATGDDGLHADAKLAITAGTVDISKSYEGIEGLSIDIFGGDISLISSDDGLNAAGGNDQSGFGGNRRNDAFASSSDSYIAISGGTLYINASGDGIDSNGSLTISGGETYVSGPADNANGVLDYASDAAISGGTFVAAGSSGMSQNFGSSSTQGVMMVSVGSQPAGSAVKLTDSTGQVLVSWQADKAFDSVMISCPQITQGSSYTLTANDSSTQITMDSLVYGSGGMGGMTGRGGMGGGRGNRP